MVTISSARLYITATFNNTLITVTDANGNVLTWGSTGSAGFKGARKATPFASTTAITKIIDKIKTLGITNLQVFIKGPGAGREAVLGVIRASGLKISQIADITPMPHNGCRPKKHRHG